jgi:predicted site-specific integrase-resolvase
MNMQTDQHYLSALAHDRVAPVPEAAGLIGVSPWTLERLAKAGKIKILKLSPRRKGIRLSEIHRFLEASGE